MSGRILDTHFVFGVRFLGAAAAACFCHRAKASACMPSIGGRELVDGTGEDLPVFINPLLVENPVFGVQLL